METFDEVLGLDVLKAHAEELDGLMVIKRGIRFSVQPVDKEALPARAEAREGEDEGPLS